MRAGVGGASRPTERCRKRHRLAYQSQAALFKCGGIDRTWTAGDNVSLAVGQGDLAATPLQMAVAFSAIANGGKIVRPRLGEAVEDGQGSLVQELERPVRRRVKIDPRDRATVMEGLRQAAMEDGGTSTAVFKGFPGTVYGKTGTAERPPNPDQSWYMAYATRPRCSASSRTSPGGRGRWSWVAAPSA